MSTTTTEIVYDINVPYKLTAEDQKHAPKVHTKYTQYLPTWDPIWFDPLPPFQFDDPALRANPLKPNFLKAGVTQQTITPRMGTILHGVDLTQLSPSAKDELALLCSERKILVFPSQESFLDAGPAFQQEFMKYFGKPNYQPVSGSIPGYPGFHVIHRDGNKEEIANFFRVKTTSTLWHQDVSYEMQPPGYVMLGMLDAPPVGGDTVFAATDEAYTRLSPTFRQKLDDIIAVHSSRSMTEHTKRVGGLVRKDPVTSLHPLVRVHPITKQKCIFLNGEFITGFEGMKDPEFRMISDFLLEHLITGHDFQARVSWSPGCVVIFDNRSTIHTAVVDYINDDGRAEPRHIFRLASMAEIPISVEEGIKRGLVSE